MKDNKIQIKTKKGCQSINVKLLKGQQVNFREVQIINQRAIPQLMPVNYDDSAKMISFNTTGCYSLKERFKGVMNKRQFIDMLLEIIELMKNLQDKVMYQKNLLLDFDKIYYTPNQMDKKLLFLYIPIMNYDNHVNMKDYFMKMPYTIVFNNGESLDYVNEFIAYFNNNINFSVYDFEMFVHRMAGNDESLKSDDSKNQTNVEKTDNNICPNCGFVNVAEAIYCQSCGCRLGETVSNEYNPIKAVSEKLYERNNAAFGSERRQEQNQKVEMTGGTTFLGAVTGADATVILTPPEPEKKAVLIRRKNNEKILLNLPKFIVGKEVAKVNYAIMNNNTVSRTHAFFAKDGNEFCIEDMSSTNGTFVNDVRLEAGKPYKITDGDIIRLSDEEFIFECK